MKLEIKIHSFIDIITNSSTEIFVQASQKTIDNIKLLIDNILAIGGSQLKCDDIFLLSLNSEDEDGYEDYEKIYIETNCLLDTPEAKMATSILNRLQFLFQAVEISN